MSKKRVKIEFAKMVFQKVKTRAGGILVRSRVGRGVLRVAKSRFLDGFWTVLAGF